ncbi:MAG TPA: SH3 domain-containing protein [Allosphingosinicella sp.]|nr:SH3 domain-containing protein [Allosphingosinicella sp.]
MNKSLIFIAALAGLGASLASAQTGSRRAPTQAGFDRPVAAGSWGGVVRSGPGMEHARLASLREGERVELLYDTGIMRDGYPWFLIRFRGNQLGFQWGGILCRLQVPVEGLYESCRR